MTGALLLLSACSARLTPPSEALLIIGQSDERGVTIYNSSDSRVVSLNTLAAAWMESGIVYIGEAHGTAEHPELAAQLVRLALASGRPVQIGLEMLPWDLQDAATAYAQGELNEEEFLEAVSWETTWGYDWEAYAPLVRLAQEPGVELIALNAPRGLTRDIFRNGLESLSDEQRALMPPILDLTNSAHRRAVVGALYNHAGADESERDPDLEERFYSAQVTWDETMAHQLSEAWANGPEQRLAIMLGGWMHVYAGWGVPDRVERETGVRGVRVICLQQSTPAPDTIDPDASDYYCIPR